MVDKVFSIFSVSYGSFSQNFSLEHGMVILIHRFEVLNVEVVPLMDGLREDNNLLLLILLLQSKLESLWVLFHQMFSFEICMDMVPYYV